MAKRSGAESVVRPRPLNADRDFIRQVAEKVRASLGHSAGDTLDLRDVVARLGGHIRYSNFWDALTEDGSIEIRGPHDFDIVLSDATSPKRDRFTIAHELGHYFLHFPAQRPQMAEGQVMVGQRSAVGKEETEAHWFAAELLMPASEFKRCWQGFEGRLAAVADKFDVSTHAAAVRASYLGLAAPGSYGLPSD